LAPTPSGWREALSLGCDKPPRMLYQLFSGYTFRVRCALWRHRWRPSQLRCRFAGRHAWQVFEEIVVERRRPRLARWTLCTVCGVSWHNDIPDKNDGEFAALACVVKIKHEPWGPVPHFDWVEGRIFAPDSFAAARAFARDRRLRYSRVMVTDITSRLTFKPDLHAPAELYEILDADVGFVGSQHGRSSRAGGQSQPN